MTNYGYTAGGYAISAVTEKYDDVADTWIAKANLNTAREALAGFSLNGFGYTAGGYTAANSATTEKYDDDANTWTVKTSLNTARRHVSGFSLNGYGYTAGGIGGSAVTEKYDDVANTWTVKANLNTARNGLVGFSLNSYGYTAGGFGNSAAVEKYDDAADTWTVKTPLNTAREAPAGFLLNNYGYTAGGYGGEVVTEKYNDAANTWTVKANLNTGRYSLAGFDITIPPPSEVTISCPIGWCYVALDSASKTLLELDNLFSTDTIQGRYNATSQKYESHRTGYAFNQNVSVSQKEGYYYYFTTATDIITTPGSTPSITLRQGWNLVANYQTSARTLSELKTSIGATATSAKYYDRTYKMWVSYDWQEVPAMEAFMVYVTSQTEWSG